jgi:two-component sensor histidine kinase/CHASE2 domain-containing sensor protein
MLKQRSHSHLFAVAVFALLAGLAKLGGVAWFRDAELSVQDALMRFGSSAPADPRLVFLARDTASASLEAADLDSIFDLTQADADSKRALDLMAHEWPWPRDVYALILDRLITAGARTVIFDFTFPKASPEDDAFRAALDRHRDHVVVAGNITDDFDGHSSVFSTPTDTLIAQTSPRDTRIGFDNFWTDAGGIVRHAQYRWAVEHGVWESPEELSLAARALQKAGFAASIPADRQSHLLRLAGRPGTFRPYSIHEIFVPEYWKRNYAGGEFFRDKVIIIGAAGNWQHDEHQTALGMMSGPELQLNAINAAIHGSFVRAVPWPIEFALWLAAAVGTVTCCLYCKSPFLRMGLIGISGVLWAGVQVALFNKPGLLIPVVGPAAILMLSGVFSITYDLVSAGAEHLRLRKAIIERRHAEEILKRSNDELERRVQERTIELSRSNESLTGLLAEKDVLLKEIHHRVKNNLQTISSLLNLQSGNIKDPDALQLFMETRYRVRSMALIHEKLYQSHDLSRIDFADYLKALTSGLAGSFTGVASAVRISVDVEDIMLAVDSAVPCGLIVNELVTNCFKYAFTGGRSGEINVRMQRTADAQFRLSVADNGVGFPKNVNFRETDSLGMQLVTTLTDQLDGNVEMTNGTGTKFEITFPETSQ